MKPRFFLRQLVRESRGARARLVFFALCLAVGVAAVVAVAGFSATLRAGLRAEARQLMAADLRIEGSRALVQAFPDWLLLSHYARVLQPAHAG